MRILALQFRNLNSLRGDHEIDFTAEPLRDAGIFAITGPTGAGKTTILDVITLALYGRAARYDRAQPTEMMSRHTGECFAEVHFECRGRCYGARWELRRSRGKADGSLQPAKRIIYDLNDKTVLVEKVKEVDAWVAEHTGLDYQRFLRSVLLAQGEFTAFLRATDKERGHLLEKLTGTEIYAELSTLAHEVTREKRQALSDLERETQGLEILSDEARRALETTLAEKRRTQQVLEKTVAHGRECLTCRERWLALERQRQDWAQEHQQLEQEERQAEPWLKRFLAHQRAEPFAALIARWQTNQQRRQQGEQDIKALAQKLDSLQKQSSESELALQAKRDQLAKITADRATLQALFTKVSPIDAELKSLQEQVSKAKQSMKALHERRGDMERKAKAKAVELATNNKSLHESEQWLDQHREDQSLGEQLPEWNRQVEAWTHLHQQVQNHSKRRLQLTDQRQAILDQRKAQELLLADTPSKLTDNDALLTKWQGEREALLEGKSVSVWERLPRELGEYRLLYDRVLTKCEQYRKRLQQMETLKVQREQDATTLKSKSQQRFELKREIEALSVDVERRAQLIRHLQEIQNLRTALQDNDPCPVCGAKEHPTGTHPVCLPDEQERQRLEGELAQRQKIEQQLASEIVRLDDRLKRYQADQEQHQQELGLLEEEVLVLQQHAPDQPFTCRDHEKLIARLADLGKAQMRADQRLVSLRKLENAIIEAKDTRERLRSRMQTTRGMLDRLGGQLQAMDKELARLVEEQSAVDARLRASQSSLTSKLKLNLTASADDVGTALQQCLARLSETFQSFEKQRQHLQQQQQQRAHLQIEQQSLQQQGDQLSKQCQEAEQQVKTLQQRQERLQGHRQQLAGDRNLQEECQSQEALEQQSRKVVESLTAVHANVREELRGNTVLREQAASQREALLEEQQSLLGALKEAASKAEFRDVKAMTDACLPVEEASKLAREQDRLRRQRLQIQVTDRHLSKQSIELDERANNLGIIDLESSEKNLMALQQIQKESEQQAQNHLRELWTCEKTLQEDAERQNRRQSQAKFISLKQQELQRWLQLNNLIGSADGSVFSRFAQGLTLARLIELANAHMTRLTDRYGIQRHPDRDLEIQIIDRYQANAVRSMQSLSGGESFLVSLALALGLSELAGNEGSIDSLFIDEGFGSLDSDSLEVALRALENLQAHHKTIGVISHTDLLKERVTCQIQVTRGKGGVSTLKVTQRASG